MFSTLLFLVEELIASCLHPCLLLVHIRKRKRKDKTEYPRKSRYILFIILKQLWYVELHIIIINGIQLNSFLYSIVLSSNVHQIWNLRLWTVGHEKRIYFCNSQLYWMELEAFQEGIFRCREYDIRKQSIFLESICTKISYHNPIDVTAQG